MEIRLAGILPNSLSNGPGLRKVLFSQGCSKKCKGCFNSHTWSFNEGTLCDCDQIIKEIIDESYLAGVTFSGGDPLEQIEPFTYIAKKLKQANVNIWVYTGFTFEQVLALAKKDVNYQILLDNIDVIIDGLYIESQADDSLLYRGSTNQRLIDVKETMKNKKITLWHE